MKKVKSFNVGDKVFAKVKGYPAWPAKVVNKTDRKYDVLFYGTKETGSLKAEDIFYYLKHKAQFLKKPINRKYYTEAIEEIEADIKEAGSDGNNEPESLDASVILNASLNGSLGEPKKVNKRKRSHTPDTGDVAQKKTARKSVSDEANKVEAAAETEEERGALKKETTKGKSATSKSEESSEKPSDRKEKRATKVRKHVVGNSTLDGFLLTPNNKEGRKERAGGGEEEGEMVEVVPKGGEEVKVNIISTEYLRGVVEYAAKVKATEELYKKKSIEKRQAKENQVLIAKLPAGSYVGIKYNCEEAKTKLRNEYEQARHDEKEAARVLDLKEKLEDGSMKPHDNPTLFVMDINKTEQQIKEAVEWRLLERKGEKLDWLKVESHMVDLDMQIKSALGLFNADPQKAMDYLQTMLTLQIDSLMLKKHPHVADMIKRLRKYIGNTKEWKMTEDEETLFKGHAENIRTLADKVYHKFKNVFEVPEGKSFWDIFSGEVAAFKEKTKNLTEAEMFSLCSEPDSRQAFLDKCFEENWNDAIEEDTPSEQEKQNKENSSQVANGNTEETHNDNTNTENNTSTS